MRERLQQRLQSLKAEHESGQKVLAELEAKQANVRDTLLRISGAIQVLEEMLTQGEAAVSGQASEATGSTPTAVLGHASSPGEGGL
ncbi:hypothetical protein IQ265_15250 [Nodosilinea sp. LEGE 06152]|uniref:hypothetical protein n=1 Tax=Nodosilinea sp. LEGE 06152 TaxID=2777966 RepID=UPI00187E0FE7|nr:hypothetical protein [Nodosilinea sp. LEGE 06152]MBE9158173.1 hypothetical protein [Nodosilinea sp. LEGE 06152]